MRIVTVSSGAITIHALTSGVAGSSYQTALGVVCASARCGTQNPSTKAPWAATTVARNSRRLTPAVFSLMSRPLLHQVSGQMDSLPDAVVGAAATCVGHLRFDVGVGRVWTRPQQRERAHDHAGLTVPALRRVEFLPGNLDRMASVGRDSFDRHDRFADGDRGGGAAGAGRPAPGHAP